jgi:S1-C subfamily serine protease
MRKLAYIYCFAMVFSGCVTPLVDVIDIDEDTAMSLNEKILVFSSPDLSRIKYQQLGTITATSCKFRKWDPPATQENAITQLKYISNIQGGNGLAHLTCDPMEGTNQKKRCWSSVTCRAVAIKIQDKSGDFKEVEVATPSHRPVAPQPSTEQRIASGGTGFLFSSKDYVITNYHVVKGANSIFAKFTNGQTVEAVVVAKDPKNDIAILKLANASPLSTTPIKLGDSSSARMGEKIFTIGYPASKIMGEKPKYSEGVINSMTGLRDDPAFFQVSVPIQPGNSGGPLFNEKGEVIGMTTASLSPLAGHAMGAIPQNVNYAIKASFVKNLLSTIPELMLSNTGIVVVPNEPGNALPNFIEQVSKNIVLIEAK